MNEHELSAAELGCVRVAVASPELKVADTTFNALAIEAAVRQAAESGAVLVATPELAMTGYTAGDLFFSDHLVENAWNELGGLVDRLSDLPHVAVVVGLPIRVPDGRMFNCAAMFGNGAIVGVVPKQFLPNRAEFYEDRWFVRALGANLPTHLAGGIIPFGTDLLFNLAANHKAHVGIEICEDLWAVEPPSGPLALAGATILVNPSGSPDQLGKAPYRRDLVRQQSARCLAAYLYAGAGPGESTMDVVFGGHSLIAENGTVLAETERFRFDTQIAVADLDTQRLLHERQMNSSFANASVPSVRWIDVPLDAAPAHPPSHARLKRPVPRHPFVPSNLAERSANCEEIFTIQATGLAKRMRHTGSKCAVVGVSGGLDSTLALLVMVRAFDTLGLDRSGITAITMPGFGTTDRTYQNALGLMKALGTTTREISIAAAVRSHFADIGHDEADHDVVYENSQARERTQILMDVANELGGFVVGTGDLSEAALGWMTFNGDHMSMYHVNAGVPKTLVRYLVSWAADAVFEGEASRILHDIGATPITPELLPLKDGQLEQKTEDTVGPYELHDFFLFHVVRYGCRPSKVFALAQHAFQRSDDPVVHETSDARPSDAQPGAEQQYDDATILKWLEIFHRRFFAQQFKRSSMPDGPKVGSVALSPRGDWRMPSDASGSTWLAEINQLRKGH